MRKKKLNLLTRDTTWLSFNERVLQEANDKRNTLYERLRFLGIFSNNLDEFYRVRIAALNNLLTVKVSQKKTTEARSISQLLLVIDKQLLKQQQIFKQYTENIFEELKKIKIFLKRNDELTQAQILFLEKYFEEQLRNDIMPLMIESIPNLPPLRDKNLFLACVLGNENSPLMQTYALIEVPASSTKRFVLLPSIAKEKHYILIEDVIRLFLPKLFGQFGFTNYETSIIKITKDADVDFDMEIGSDVIEKITKGVKNRKKGAAMRFIYEAGMDKKLLKYLTSLFKVNNKQKVLAGGRIHNFKDFMDFPTDGFSAKHQMENLPAFVHPLLKQPKLILGVLDKQDVMLHFPYHSFDSIIDLLKEASIDPYVTNIKITAYRLAKNSKVANALINAARNGKQVQIVLELKARFDEEANVQWKAKLEEEGVKVFIGKPNMKVHAKLCLITKVQFNNTKQYGFVSTGNLNERTSVIYSDSCLLTSDARILKEVSTMFNFLMSNKASLSASFKYLVTSPDHTRNKFLDLINNEIKNKKANRPAGIILKLNNLSDEKLITKLQEAIKAKVSVQCIVRSAFCLPIESQRQLKHVKAISIIDNYLEHARVIHFVNNRKPITFISSADWMVRNLDNRVEASVPILQKNIQDELVQLLSLQLSENVKARELNTSMLNEYVQPQPNETLVQSQRAIYDYLCQIKYN